MLATSVLGPALAPFLPKDSLESMTSKGLARRVAQPYVANSRRRDT